MIKNRKVADVVKECVLKGGMSRADILQEVKNRGHAYITSVATIKDYIERLRNAGELPKASPGVNFRYQRGSAKPEKPKPETKKIQKPRNLEIQKNRKPESKEYRKMTFQLRPDQETDLLLYRAKHKLKLSEIVRRALDKFLRG